MFKEGTGKRLTEYWALELPALTTHLKITEVNLTHVVVLSLFLPGRIILLLKYSRKGNEYIRLCSPYTETLVGVKCSSSLSEPLKSSMVMSEKYVCLENKN